MTIIREYMNGDRFTINLTPEETYNTYCEQREAFLRSDALQHFLDIAGIDPEVQSDTEIIENRVIFIDKYGVDPHDILDSNDVVTSFIREFSDNFDCNVAENTLWENAIRNVLSREEFPLCIQRKIRAYG